ncbi:MAG: hypothetical protein QM528_08615 [Phycisphaerales bacterium]|nr:hypothetical protein [Phycisphaerales bacterium]
MNLSSRQFLVVVLLSALFSCKKIKENANSTYPIDLLSPANNASNQPVQPIFVWKNNVRSAVTFTVYYGTSLANLQPDRYFMFQTGTSDTIRNSVRFSYNTNYFWKVIGYNSDGVAVDSSSVQSFLVRQPIKLSVPRANLAATAVGNKIYFWHY